MLESIPPGLRNRGLAHPGTITNPAASPFVIFEG